MRRLKWMWMKLREEDGWAAIPAIIALGSAVFSGIEQSKQTKAAVNASDAQAKAASSTGGPTTAAPASGAASAAAPGSSPQSNTAYWQNLLSGTGQIAPGAPLPADIQQNIDQQASLGPGQ